MGGLIGAPAFQATFHSPGPTMLGLIVSIMEVGAFIGSIISAILGEQLGRKKSIAIAVCIMMIGSLLQATAFNRAHLIAARVIAGVGLGICNSTAPVLQSEYSPKASRGLCKTSILLNTSETNYCRCLYTAFYSQLRYFPRLLDWIRIFNSYQQLCLENTMHSSTCYANSDACSLLAYR